MPTTSLRLLRVPLSGVDLPPVAGAFNGTWQFLVDHSLPLDLSLSIAEPPEEMNVPDGLWQDRQDELQRLGEAARADWVRAMSWQPWNQLSPSEADRWLLDKTPPEGLMHLYLYDVKNQRFKLHDVRPWSWWVKSSTKADSQQRLWWPGYREAVLWVAKQFVHHASEAMPKAGAHKTSESGCLPLDEAVFEAADAFAQVTYLPDSELQYHGWQELAEQHPESWLPFYMLSKEALQYESWVEAEPALEQCLRNLNRLEQEQYWLPQDLLGRLYWQLGQTYQALNKPLEAKRVLESATQAKPLDFMTQKHLAELYEAHEEWDAAKASYQRCLSLLPQLASTYQALGTLHARTNSWEEALAMYQLQLLMEPDEPWAHCNIANCYLQFNQSDKARQHLAYVLELNASAPQDALDYAGLVLAGLDAAEQEKKQALSF